jgi:hypothetical protein
VSNKKWRKKPTFAPVLRAAAKKAVAARGEKVRTKAEWDAEVLDKRRAYLLKSGGKPFPNRKQRRQETRNAKLRGRGYTKPLAKGERFKKPLHATV